MVFRLVLFNELKKKKDSRFLRFNWDPIKVGPWWCDNYFINTKINIIHEENSTILTKIILKKG